MKAQKRPPRTAKRAAPTLAAATEALNTIETLDFIYDLDSFYTLQKLIDCIGAPAERATAPEAPLEPTQSTKEE